MLKLKENIIYKHLNATDKTVITHATRIFEIEDVNQSYYTMLSKGIFSKETIDLDFFNFLLNENMLFLDYAPPKKHSRNYRYISSIKYLESIVSTVERSPLEIFESVIRQKRIAIIGVGGIGTVVLKNLLNDGFAKFLLIDFDKIDVSNLNRQLFYTIDDVGLNKLDVLKRRILSDFEDVEVITKEQRIEGVDDLLKVLEKFSPDILVNAADSPKNITNITNEVASKVKIPCLSGTVGIETSSWQFRRSTTGNKKSVEYDYKLSGSNSSTNMLLGSIMSMEIEKTLLYEYITLQNNDDYHKILDFRNLAIEDM
jgi:hypothetical protein